MKSIVLPAGTEHVQFGELAHRIADALWPDAGPDDNRLRHASTVTKIKAELIRAVNSGALAVKDPDTLGEHTFPIGDALNRAFVSVDDLREFVAGRGLSVSFQFSINEDGGSTTFRATQEEYDAMAAGKQAQGDERHKRGHYSMYEAAEVLAAANSIGGAEAFLKNRMRPAVESGALMLLDPIDGGPVTGRLCRPYDDWVTPKAIDEWLAGAGFTYRWPVTPTATQAPPVLAASVVIHSTKKRRDSITPAIERAQSKCKDPRDTAEVWGHMELLALDECPPFQGRAQEGLMYTKNRKVCYFTRDALRLRLHPELRAPRK